jgi:DNA (cytosine-5)-methyltransferase 1
MESNTFIDLFAGCGGASLGFKRAGFILKAAVELDPVTCRSYADNHPEAALLINDIRLLSAQDILEKAGLGVGQCTVVLGVDRQR